MSTFLYAGWEFQHSLDAIHNSPSHNLVFVGSLLKISVCIYEINCSLLLMPRSVRKTSTCPKHCFTWRLGGLKPRPYRKGDRKSLFNDISSVFLESQAVEILSLIISSLGWTHIKKRLKKMFWGETATCPLTFWLFRTLLTMSGCLLFH